MTKCKVSNLFDIFIKIVKKCCATHFQGNYTKDKQGKAFRQYQNISEKESFGHLLSQRFWDRFKDSEICEERWPVDYLKVTFYGKERP